MYTKRQIIEQVFLRLNDGQIDPSSANVKEADIAPFISEALRYVLIETARVRRAEENPMASYAEFIDRALITSKTYTLSRTGNVAHFEANNLMVLPKDIGVFDVFPTSLESNRAFHRMKSRQGDFGLEDAWASKTRYWLERVDGTGNYKVYIRNLSKQVEQVQADVILDFSAYKENEIVPTVDGTGIRVFEMAVKFFEGQNQEGDMLNDNRQRQIA